MKISLKQARRVEREIGAELELSTTHTRHHGRGQVSVSIYEDIRSKVAALQEQTLAGLTRVKELTRIRFAIRKEIETQNEVAGLNALMNREAELKAMSKVLTNLMTVELTDADLDIAASRHAAAKLANEKGTVVQSSYGEASDAIVMGTVLRTDTLETLRTYAKSIQRELLTTVDKLAALNAGTQVVIADADAKILEDAGIVV